MGQHNLLKTASLHGLPVFIPHESIRLSVFQTGYQPLLFPLVKRPPYFELFEFYSQLRGIFVEDPESGFASATYGLRQGAQRRKYMSNYIKEHLDHDGDDGRGFL